LAKEFCEKLNKFKKKNPLLIYICLNTKNTPIELLQEFKFLIDIYDPMLGLNKKDEEREIILIKKSQGCFCRDTRIKYFFKMQKEKNLLKKLHFAPDFPADIFESKKEKNKAVSVGWLDGVEDNNSPLNQFISTCRSKCVEPWIIPSKFQKDMVKKRKDLLSIFPKNRLEYEKLLSSFSFGLVQPCWNRQGDFLYPEWYLARASSSRIMDYLANDMTLVIPKYLRFQIWMAKKGNFEPVVFDKKINFEFKIKNRITSKTISEFWNYHEKKIALLIESIYKL